jgi:hypothetical protein
VRNHDFDQEQVFELSLPINGQGKIGGWLSKKEFKKR